MPINWFSLSRNRTYLLLLSAAEPGDFPALPYAGKVLQGVKHALLEFSVKEADVYELDGKKAALAEIRKMLAELKGALNKGDRLIVAVCMQSLREGKQYWLPADARKGRPETWLPVEEFLAFLQEAPARNVMGLIDAGFPAEELQREKKEGGKGQSRHLICSGVEMPSHYEEEYTARFEFWKKAIDFLRDAGNTSVSGKELGEEISSAGPYLTDFKPPQSGWLKQENFRTIDFELTRSKRSRPAFELDKLEDFSTHKKIEIPDVEAPRSVDSGAEPPEETAPPSPPREAEEEKSTGELLYDIPEQMQLQKPTRCWIRIAKNKEQLVVDLPDKEVSTEKITISKVMDVDLVDVSGGECFMIVAGTGDEQYLSEEKYTQWVYYVTPLRAGAFPLLLKISTLQFIDGRERKRDITYERLIRIETTPDKGSQTYGSPMSSEQEGLQRQLDLLIRKLNHLKEALILETDPSRQFSLEEQIRKLEGEVAEARDQLEKIGKQQPAPEAPTPDVSAAPSTLDDFRKQARRQIMLDLGKALDFLNEHLSDRSDHFNTLILNTANYNSTHKQELNGLITHTDANIIYARLRNALLYIVENLEEGDIK